MMTMQFSLERLRHDKRVAVAATVAMGVALAVFPFIVGSAMGNSRLRVVGFAGSAVDVTARIKAQDQLQAQLAFTELLLEVMPLPLSILDAQGRYVSVNQA